MNYTLFELERIEKILTVKLESAGDQYERRLAIVRGEFRNWLVENGRISSVSDLVMSGDAVGVHGQPVSGEMSKDWAKFQDTDEILYMLKEEVDLFKRGIDSLYSYWNYSVEIFIDNMREKAENHETK